MAQPRHVLERENMSPHFLQLFRHIDVVFERVFVAVRV